MPRVSKGADVVSATSGLGGIFGFEVVCRGSLGTIVFCGDSVLNATNSRSSETD